MANSDCILIITRTDERRGDEECSRLVRHQKSRKGEEAVSIKKTSKRAHDLKGPIMEQ